MIDFKLLNRQKILLLLSVSFFILFALVPTFQRSNPKSLKLNINKASYYQLLDIPYIGKKTAKEILRLRKEKGRFSSIEELKSVRNYKKFKQYIKVE